MNKEFMFEALELAKMSGDDIPVGCVIVKDDKIISFGVNEREENNKISSHAEIVAMEKAEQKLGTWKLDECEMYVTLEPCPMCACAIVQARIKKVFFGAYDTNYGAFGSKINMLDIMNAKAPKVYGGLMELECREIITKYFDEMRKNA